VADNRSRKERLADPERWYQCVSIGRDGETIDVEGNQLFLKGRIDDIVIVTIPREISGSASDIARAMTEAIQASGIARDVIVVPEDVKLMKLRPIALDKSKQLDRQKRNAAVVQKAKREKAN